MNESSIFQFNCNQILHVLTFYVLLWTIKFNFRRFLGRLSTNVIDTIAYTNSFCNQYFSVDQSDLRQRKQRIHKLFIGLR